MKILAINGSHRGKNGYLEFLINKIFEGASYAGAQCEVIRLSDHEIRRCSGCFSCQRKERLFQCIYDGKDEARFVYDKMKQADLIIYATPVYIFNMSGLLKNLFDRFLFTCNLREICSSTERKANKEIIKVPLFVKILMRFRFFRSKAEVRIRKRMEGIPL